MSTARFHFTWTIAIVGCFAVIPLAIGQERHSEEEFFETRIRPVFIEHCFKCHAFETEINGGLALDSAAGWARGGDSGAAIEKGNPEHSLLIKAIEYRDPKLQMPPEGKLSERIIDDLKEWISRGAFDPRPETQSPKVSTALPLERAYEHWAYRPILDPVTPQSTAATAIDAFLQEKLEQAELEMTSRASRSVLIRRLKFDLHGLPATPDEIARFASDPAPDAYEKLVDSLLASPRYAERMARRWLDVVRFAESLTLRGFVLGNAWRYRDYCIQCFAEDRPFDEVIREQIAGDLMSSSDLKTRQRQTIATTFLLLGNTNLEEQDKEQLEMDLIDEQLDTFGKAILGQTIGCARCHDHKFDPIPTRDYYALAGTLKVFQVLEHENVSKWIEQPLPSLPGDEKHFQNLSSQISQLNKDIDRRRKLLSKATKRSSPMVAVSELQGIVVDDSVAKKIGNWQTSKSVSVYVGEGYIHDSNEQMGSKTVTFEPNAIPPGNYEVRLAYAPGPSRSTRTRISVFSADGETQLSIDQRVDPPIDGLWVSLGRYRFEKDGQAFVIVSNEGANGHVIADAVQFLLDSTPSNLAKIEKTQNKSDEADANKSLTNEIKKLEANKKKLEAILKTQPKAMSMKLRQDAGDIPVHIRGDVHNLGQTVPRGPLQLVNIPRLASTKEKPFDRLDLAEWVTAPEQPLVARVLANRIWSWLMCEGIVRTVDNFGTTGEAPSHPELLDYLATQLVKHRWSVRHLVREIVLTDAYQRSSETIQDSEAIDPANQLLWRAHRRRLDAEVLRDTILAISGQLQLDMFGKRMPEDLKTDYGYLHNDTCRSIYVPVFRNAIPELFEAFDVADPSAVVGKRNRSTIASQALWMMNHPWVLNQSQETAKRIHAERESLSDSVIEQASLRILGRPLLPEEMTSISSYLEAQESDSFSTLQTMDQEVLTTIVQALFQSLDFRFPK